MSVASRLSTVVSLWFLGYGIHQACTPYYPVDNVWNFWDRDSPLPRDSRHTSLRTVHTGNGEVDHDVDLTFNVASSRMIYPFSIMCRVSVWMGKMITFFSANIAGR